MNEEKKKLVLKAARTYLSRKSATYAYVSTRLNISTSTVGKYLNCYLKELDMELYTRVQEKKQNNILRTRKNLKMYKK